MNLSTSLGTWNLTWLFITAFFIQQNVWNNPWLSIHRWNNSGHIHPMEYLVVAFENGKMRSRKNEKVIHLLCAKCPRWNKVQNTRYNTPTTEHTGQGYPAGQKWADWCPVLLRSSSLCLPHHRPMHLKDEGWGRERFNRRAGRLRRWQASTSNKHLTGVWMSGSFIHQKQWGTKVNRQNRRKCHGEVKVEGLQSGKTSPRE